MSSGGSGRLATALEELQRVTGARRQLHPASPEYQAALREELRLVTEIRRLLEADRASEGLSDYVPDSDGIGGGSGR